MRQGLSKLQKNSPAVSSTGVIFILPEGVNLIMPEGVSPACPKGSNSRAFSEELISQSFFFISRSKFSELSLFITISRSRLDSARDSQSCEASYADLWNRKPPRPKRNYKKQQTDMAICAGVLIFMLHFCNLVFWRLMASLARALGISCACIVSVLRSNSSDIF